MTRTAPHLICLLLLSSSALSTLAFFAPLSAAPLRPSTLSSSATRALRSSAPKLTSSLPQSSHSAQLNAHPSAQTPSAPKKSANPFAKFFIVFFTILGLGGPAFAWKSTPLPEPTPAQAIEKTYATAEAQKGQHIYIARGQGAAELLEAAETLDKATAKETLTTWKKKSCREILEMPTQTRQEHMSEGLGAKIIHHLHSYAAPLLVLWIPNMIVVPWYLLLTRQEEHKRWRKFIVGREVAVAPNVVQKFAQRSGI